MKKIIYILVCFLVCGCEPEIPVFWPTEITIKVRNISGEDIDGIKLKAVNGTNPYDTWRSSANDSIMFNLKASADTTIVWKPKIEGYGHVVLGKEGYLFRDSLGYIQKYYSGSRFESSDPAYNTFLADSVSQERW